MIRSIARVPTSKSSRYLQQLCKHWSHNLAVEFTPETGTVVFPRNARGADWPGDATLTMQAHGDSLECRFRLSRGRDLRRRRLGWRRDATLRPAKPGQVESGRENESAEERDDDRRTKACTGMPVCHSAIPTSDEEC